MANEDLKKRIQSGSSEDRSSYRVGSYDDLKNRIKKYGVTSDVDSDYISSFQNDSQSFLSDLARQASQNTWSTAKQNSSDFTSRWNEMNDRMLNIRAYMNSNKSKMSREDFDSAMKYLDEYDASSRKYGNILNEQERYFRNWASQEAYDQAIRQTQLRNEAESYDFEAGAQRIKSLTDLKDSVDKERKNRPNYTYDEFVTQHIDEGKDPDVARDLALQDMANHPDRLIEQAGFASYEDMEAALKNEQQNYDRYRYITAGEDWKGETYDTDMRVKAIEDTILNMTSDEEANRTYEQILTDSQEISDLERVSELAANTPDWDINPIRAESAEDNHLLLTVASKYGLDLTRSAQELQQEIADRVAGPLSQKRDEDISTLREQGYDYKEIEYYNKWKEDRDAYYSGERAEEVAQEAIDHPVASTIMSILSSPLQAAEYAKNATYAMIAGKDSAYGLANIYDDKYTNYSQEATAAIAQHISDKVGGDGTSAARNLAAWLASNTYSGITSSMQSAIIGGVGMALFGPAGEAVALGLMSTQAANSQFQESIKNGQSNGQALLMSFAAGINEALFEKISLEKLQSIKSYIDSQAWDRKTVVDLFKSMLSNSPKLFMQGVTEGSEEFFTELANIAADAIIGGDKSSFNIEVIKNLNKGYTEREAWSEAIKSNAQNVLASMYGGFIGGLTSGASVNMQQGLVNLPSAVRNTSAVNQLGQDVVDSGNVEQLISGARDTASETGSNSLRKLAEQVAKNPTNTSKVGRLSTELSEAQANRTAASHKDAVKAVVLSELENNTDVKNKDLAAEVIAKKEAGETLSKREQRAYDEARGDKIINSLRNGDLQSAVEKAESDLNVQRTRQQINTASLNRTQAREGQVSESGKTTDVNSGKEISIKGISSIKNGEMTLKLEDGSTILSSNVAYANENQAALYEGAATLGVNPATAESVVRNYDSGGKLSVETYLLGMKEGIRYGSINYPYSKISANSFFSDLQETQKRAAYRLGQIEAQTSVDNRQAQMKSRKAGTQRKGEIVYMDSVGELTERQKTSVQALEKIIKGTTNNTVHLYASVEENGNRVFAEDVAGHKKGTAAPNGFYIEGNGDIYIDVNAGNGGEGIILWTASHELTHFVRDWSPESFKNLADFLVENYVESGVDVDARVRAIMQERGLSYDAAYEEFIAQSMETMLTDTDALQKLEKLREKDPTLWEKIKEFIADLLNRVREAYAGLDPQTEEARMVSQMSDKLEQLSDMFAMAIDEAGRVYSTNEALGEADIDGNVSNHEFSVRSMSEGAGLQFHFDEYSGEYHITDANGKEVDHVDVENIKGSPLGNLVKIAKDNGNISAADADRQYQFLTDLVNLCLDNKENFTAVWEIAGTQVFSAIKSNSDTQYGKTIDFSTVCKKTQQIINVMSETQVRLGRGLTKDEVKNIVYYETGKAGEPTPCPVCYVFSRWMGIGGILDQMNKFQEKYSGKTEKEMRFFINSVEKELYDFANTPTRSGKLKADFFDKNGKVKLGGVMAALKSKVSGDIKKANNAIIRNANVKLQIQEKETLLKNAKISEKQKIQNTIDKLRLKLKNDANLQSSLRAAENRLSRFEEYQWLTKTYMDEVKDENGNHVGWKKDEHFKVVPPDILFDMREGATFAAKYPKSWKYRTTKGCNAGKAILPYSDARVGETIQGVSYADVKDIQIGNNNAFLNGDEKTQQKYLESAVRKQKAQNLIGGMRYQSTSDFRYEYGSDYLMTFLEMQAIGAKVQMYTKVIEAVDFLCTMGAELNLSVMPLDNGFITLDDGRRQLMFSSVTGINANAAIEKTRQYDNAQLILVGISDEHIRLALEGDDVNGDVVSFVIPFHGSGNTTKTIQELMNLLGENLDVTKAQDYSAVQTDHFAKNRTAEQKALWELRKKIISRKETVSGKTHDWDGVLSSSESALLESENGRFLKDLYDRFYVNKNAEEFGVSLSYAQADQIFPYEYWDKSLSYAQADQNGERFKEYCATMGIVPRFSGEDSQGKKVNYGNFANDKGYWKLLIDRRMYNNDGTYHEPKAIDVTNFAIETLDPAWGSANYGDVMQKDTNPKKTNAIVESVLEQLEAKYSRRRANVSEEPSIKEQLDAAREQIDKMSPVFNKRTGISFKSKDDALSWAIKYLAPYKTIDRKGVGPIVFDEKRIRNGYRYQRSIQDVVSAIAVPSVIKRGEVIYSVPDHKGRGYSTVTIAAPIVIDGTKSNIAVIIKQEGKYYYKVHRIVTPSGQEIKIDTSERAGGTSQGSGLSPAESVHPHSNEDEPKSQEKRSDRYVSMTTSRIDDLISDSGAGSRKDYARMWITSINPSDFLNMTLQRENQDREVFDSKIRGDYGSTNSDFDYLSALVNEKRQTPFLAIDINTGEVVGHEGRHRMRALEKAGVQNVDIVVEFRDEDGHIIKEMNGYGNPLEIIQEMKILNQRGTGQSTMIRNIIPLNKENRENVLANYGGDGAEFKYSNRNSDGAQLSDSQVKYFKDSMIRDDDGNLLVVYHGTDQEFTVFDRTKGRSTMDIQGMFFSPWEIDAGGYGGNVGAYYLNITNPASEAQGYAALNRFKGENYAGLKARDYLESLGYDGVDNSGEEYIAFRADQIKLISNKNPTSNPDIRFSERMTSTDSRSILASALESTAQNDVEKGKLAQYKEKIALMNEQQNHLVEINAEIKKLSFAKGKRDAQKLSKLRQEATKTVNRINIYDKQLLSLESTKVLKDVLERERTKARKAAETKAKEDLAAYRQRAIAEQRGIMERYRDRMHENVEGRKKTELKRKITKKVKELNTLLLKGDTKRHVPLNLTQATIDALEAVNFDTVGAETRIAELEQEMAMTNNQAKIQDIQRKIDNLNRRDARMSEQLSALKEAYAELGRSENTNSEVGNIYDETIHDLIDYTSKDIGDTAIVDMSLEQLQSVYDMYSAVLSTIRNANKAFVANRTESLKELSASVITEIEDVGGYKESRIAGMDFFKRFAWNNLKPVYAMKAIGSETLTELFDNVRAGEDTWARDVSEARDFFLETAKKYNYNSWDLDKRYEFETNTGTNVSLSLSEIMSIAAYMKRAQAEDHLAKGGIVFDENEEVKGKVFKRTMNTANAYGLSPNVQMQIVNTLTPEQLAFVNDMQRYMSTVLAEKGNEVSRALYDINLFKEDAYFPLKVSSQYKHTTQEATGDVKLKNSGFTKKTVPNASNPIVLKGFMDVWAEHVNDMAMYHAFVLPLEDFNRVYNYHTAFTEDMDAKSVKATLQNAYSPAAGAYIDQMLRDINGGARSATGTDIPNKLTSLFKKGATFASASVVIQQPSAIARAMAVVDPKYFVTSSLKAWNPLKHGSEWNEVKKYAPVAIIKEMGYFDTGMGRQTADWITGTEYDSVLQKAGALFTDSDYRDEILGKAPALADEVAWIHIWEAAKNQTAAENNLNRDSEECKQLAGKLFTKAIVETQVYDSVLSRSALMRSKDTGVKMATAFMAEPTTNLNMLQNALLDAKRRGKVGRKLARKAIGSVLASMILNSALVSLVYAARDDDEDETYLEKYVGALVGSLSDAVNPLGMVPYIRDIVSIVEGYDVERSDMSVISDLYKGWQNLFKDSVSPWKKVETFGGAIANLFGLPLKNIMRDIRGIYNLAQTAIRDDQTTGQKLLEEVVSNMPFGKAPSTVNSLYKALVNNDEVMIARLKKKYKTASSYQTAIRKALRENDERIIEAAKAKYSGDYDTFKSLVLEIKAEGHFSQDDIVAAVNAEVTALEKASSSGVEESPWYEADEESETDGSIYKAADINTVLASGDTETAKDIIDDLVEAKKANGKTEKEARSSIQSTLTSYWKPIYIAAYNAKDSAEMERIRRMLNSLGIYSDIVKTCQNWIKNQ